MNILKKIKSKKNYILIISGPIENQSFKKKLDRSIEANNLKNKIFFTGFVGGNNKWNFIKFSELFHEYFVEICLVDDLLIMDLRLLYVLDHLAQRRNQRFLMLLHYQILHHLDIY